MRSQVSQPASVGRGTDMSELQADHFMVQEQWTWLLCSYECQTGKKNLSFKEINHVIGIKFLTIYFLEIFGS